MNKVNTYIKSKMLAYPDQYSSRWNALWSMFFLLGAGYYWDEQGCLANSFDRAPTAPGTMYFDDLDKQEVFVKERLKGDEVLDSVYNTELVKLKLERIVRGFRAENIDVFVQNHMEDEDEGGLEELTNCGPLHMLPIGTIPYGHVDHDWAKAADEAANIVRLRLRKHFDLEGADLDTHVDGLPDEYKELYRTVVTVQRELEPITQRAAKAGRILEMLKSLSRKA